VAEDGEGTPRTAWAAATRESSGKWEAERSKADYKKRSIAERLLITSQYPVVPTMYGSG
jgi:hypothetical protein